jgi:hypothetical protein
MILIALCLSAFVGIFASKYNRNGFLWFLLSLFISPILSVVILLIVGKNDREEIEENLEKLKKAHQDFLELCDTNKEAVESNPFLKRTYNELSSLEVTYETKLTVEEIEKSTNMLLMEVTRLENQSTTKDSQNNTSDNDEDAFKNIEKLQKLLDIGAITESEFTEKKQKLLEQI